MATTTDNLKLYKYDAKMDGNETFNIDLALNGNWDKVDDTVGSHTASIAKLIDATANMTADTSTLQTNFIDLAIEVETTKNAELNGVTANIAIETFLNLDDVTLERGRYDAVNKWIEV